MSRIYKPLIYNILHDACNDQTWDIQGHIWTLFWRPMMCYNKTVVLCGLVYKGDISRGIYPGTINSVYVHLLNLMFYENCCPLSFFRFTIHVAYLIHFIYMKIFSYIKTLRDFWNIDILSVIFCL